MSACEEVRLSTRFDAYDEKYHEAPQKIKEAAEKYVEPGHFGFYSCVLAFHWTVHLCLEDHHLPKLRGREWQSRVQAIAENVLSTLRPIYAITTIPKTMKSEWVEPYEFGTTCFGIQVVTCRMLREDPKKYMSIFVKGERNPDVFYHDDVDLVLAKRRKYTWPLLGKSSDNSLKYLLREALVVRDERDAVVKKHGKLPGTHLRGQISNFSEIFRRHGFEIGLCIPGKDDKMITFPIRHIGFQLRKVAAYARKVLSRTDRKIVSFLFSYKGAEVTSLDKAHASSIHIRETKGKDWLGRCKLRFEFSNAPYHFTCYNVEDFICLIFNWMDQRDRKRIWAELVEMKPIEKEPEETASSPPTAVCSIAAVAAGSK